MVCAEIAPLIYYQGRLTDENGNPLADGEYSVTFSIYASSSAPTPIWTSGEQDIKTAGGIFSYILGAVSPLPHSIFDDEVRYLGIKVGTDAEISPRSRLVAVPYAYRALKADSAATIANENDFVHTAGDTIYDDLFFDGDGDGSYEGRIYVGTSSASLYLRDGDTTTVRLYGTSYGELGLQHSTNGVKRVALVAYSSGGNLRLYNSDYDERIELNAYYTGDNSVQLTDGAINSDEILDEPGIVSGTGLNPSLTSTTFVDVATVTITTPGPGYVYVSGRSCILFGSTTGLNGAYLQIDTTAGGGNLSQDAFIFQNVFPTTETQSFEGFVDRVYYISAARTITFRLEGSRYAMSTGTVNTSRSQIKAMYFPTSYGSVKSTELSPDGFTDATPVAVQDEFGKTTTVYEVDLRELELKAKEAKIKALEAERELERAREAMERQADNE